LKENRKKKKEAGAALYFASSRACSTATQEGSSATARVQSIAVDQGNKPRTMSATLKAVTVNTRALIDKILARYSSEFTLFRELVQNADDAGASTVTIAFLSQPTREGAMLTQVTVSNNGAPFNAADWQRIVSIADGNPDETKIGFFGVGFFSVFSVSENPVVASGDRELEFQWRGNQLFFEESARKAPYNPALTSVALQWRASSRRPPPTPQSFATFATQLLCFTRSLRQVVVTLDGKAFVSAGRADEEPVQLSFAPALIQKRAAPLPAAPVASLWRGFFSALDASASATAAAAASSSTEEAVVMAEDDVAQAVVCRCVLVCSVAGEDSPRHTSLLRARAVFTTNLAADQAEELLRITKKRPSSKAAVQLLLPCMGAVGATGGDAVSPQGGKGRVFIGFATRQSTGCSAHVNGPFIPTMERDLLDFADPAVGAYNRLLLHAAGLVASSLHVLMCTQPLLARKHDGRHPFPVSTSSTATASATGTAALAAENVFTSMFKSLQAAVGVSDGPSEGELDDARTLTEGAPDELLANAHALACFAPAQPSSPSALVGQTLFNAAFISAHAHAPLVFTRQGKLMPVKQARLATLGETAFVNVPNVVVDALARRRPAEWTSTCALASLCLARLAAAGLLRPLTHDDIVGHLRATPLADMEALRKFVHWVEAAVRPGCASCRGAGCATCAAKERELMAACTVQGAWPDAAPDDVAAPSQWRWVADRSLGDVPAALLNAVIDRQLLAPTTTPRSRLLALTSLDLAGFASRALAADPTHAFAILLALCRSADRSVAKRACAAMATVDCVPTQLGLVAPRVAVLEAADGAAGLAAPIVDGALLAAHPRMRDFLVSELGVRRTPSAALVLESFARGTLQWDHVQLVGFLAQVHAEADVREAVAALKTMKFLPRATAVPGDASTTTTSRLHVPSELINPDGVPAALKSELAILAWPGDKLDAAALALLVKAGLLAEVPLAQLLAVAGNASAARETRLAAVHAVAARSPPLSVVASTPLCIVPCKGGAWAPPARCFVDPGPFPLSQADVDGAVALRLGVPSAPGAAVAVDCLTQRELAVEGAWDRVEYLAFKCGSNELTKDHLSRLAKAAIVPVDGRLVPPSRAFFSQSPALKPLFPLVDPTALAPVVLRLLRMLGVRDAPTSSEIAVQVARNPAATLKSVGQDCYLDLLRLLAAGWAQIDTAAKAALAGSACVLGQAGDDAPMTLAAARDVCVNDDFRLNRLFPEQSCVPLAELEPLYMSLGAKELSRSVQESFAFADAKPGSAQDAAVLVDARIKERAGVLLGKMPAAVLSPRVKTAWLQPIERGERLVVQVSAIRATLKLGARSIDINTTSCVARRASGALLVTACFDWYDVASALARDWLEESVRSKDRSLLWSDLLASSTESLENKGFVVKRKPVVVVAPVVAVPVAARAATKGDAEGLSGLLPSDSKPVTAAPLQLPPQASKRDAADQQPAATATARPPQQRAAAAALPPLPAGLQPKDLLAMLPPSMVAQAASAIAGAAASAPRPQAGSAVVPVRAPPAPSALARTLDSDAVRKHALQRAVQGCVGGDGPPGIQEPPRRVVMAPEPAPLDDLHEHDVVKLPERISGLEVYLERASPARVVEANAPAMKEFAQLLIGLGVEVFSLDPDCLKLYWDGASVGGRALGADALHK